MKIPGLLLALLLAAPAALHAQPTNREYKRLQEATQRAYSVPDRPAPSSAPAERSYTPSSSSGPNTPYSGGMQVVVPGTSLFGKTYETKESDLDKIERAWRETKAREAVEEAKRQAIANSPEAQAARAKAYEEEQAGKQWRMDRLDRLGAKWVQIGFELRDADDMGVAGDDYEATAELRQALVQVKEARLAAQTRLAQPDLTFAQGHALVNAEWKMVQGKQYDGGRYYGITLGVNTALRDYTALQRRFPAQASVLDAELVKLYVCLLNDHIFNVEKYMPLILAHMPTYQAQIEDAVLQQANTLAGHLSSIQYELNHSDIKERRVQNTRYGVPTIDGSETDRASLLSAIKMVYTILTTEKAQRMDAVERKKALAKCAGELLEMQPYAPDALQLDWQLDLREKYDNPPLLAAAVLRRASALAEMTPAQAQRAERLLGLVEPLDWPAAGRLLASLDSTAVPDNPKWQAMKDRPALVRQVRLLATMAAPTSAGACLVLGTLAVSVRPGEDGQAEAMEWWGKASKIGDYNQAAFTACRNKYRARVLQQTGSHADKKDKVEAYLSLGIKRHNHPGQSSYERALVLLDEHPAFPRIGVVNKREGRMYLKDAAEKNHEAAKARLARL